MARERRKVEVRIPAQQRGSKRRRSSVLQYGFDPSPSPSPPPPPGPDSGDDGDNDSGGRGDAATDQDTSLPNPNRLAALRRAAKGPIETRPGRCRGFHISRIIEYTDKAGNFQDPPRYARLNNPNFDYSIGDFVLNLSAKKSNRCRVRNYAGQQGSMPRRMLQDVYQPWCIPVNIRLDDDNGVPFPLRFMTRARMKRQGDGTAFEEDETVMVARESQNARYSEVVDFEREPGTVRKTNLDERYDRPWDLLVDQDALDHRFRLRGTKTPRRSEAVIGAAAGAAAVLVGPRAARSGGNFRVRRGGGAAA